jgi:hypothetical protein
MSGTTLARWQGILFKSNRHFPSAVRLDSDRQGLRHLESACFFLQTSRTTTFRRGHKTRQRSALIVLILFGIASLVVSSGCGVSNATPVVGQTKVAPANLAIDAGVIFADRASYLCLPLSRFGISSSDRKQRIH